MFLIICIFSVCLHLQNQFQLFSFWSVLGGRLTFNYSQISFCDILFFFCFVFYCYLASIFNFFGCSVMSVQFFIQLIYQIPNKNSKELLYFILVIIQMYIGKFSFLILIICFFSHPKLFLRFESVREIGKYINNVNGLDFFD